MTVPANRLLLRARWGPRDEAAGPAAARLLAFMPALTEALPAFGRLSLARNRPSEPVVPMGRTLDELAGQIERGRVRNDTDRRAMDGAGFLRTWDDNTRRLEQASITLAIGAVRGSNVLSVELSPESSTASVGVDRVAGIVLAAAAAFDPTSVEVYDAALLDVIGARRDRGHRCGWMLWVPGRAWRPRAARPRIERAGGGTLVVSTEEWFDGDRPEHRLAAEQMARHLSAGPLRRLLAR